MSVSARTHRRCMVSCACAVRCSAVQDDAGRFVDLIRPTYTGGALNASRAQSPMRLSVCEVSLLYGRTGSTDTDTRHWSVLLTATVHYSSFNHARTNHLKWGLKINFT